MSTKLKLGVLWDHNGTYMEGYGLQYKDHQITVELTPEDDLAGAQQSHLSKDYPPQCPLLQQLAWRLTFRLP